MSVINLTIDTGNLGPRDVAVLRAITDALSPRDPGTPSWVPGLEPESPAEAYVPEPGQRSDPVPDSAAEAAAKPKRTRRTRAQIEADEKAAAAAKEPEPAEEPEPDEEPEPVQEQADGDDLVGSDEPEYTRETAVRLATQLAINPGGHSDVVREALKAQGADKVRNLSDDDLEPFIRAIKPTADAMDV